MKQTLKITWYGRCCYLFEHDNKKILLDPYDRFCGVDIGLIDAEILISSSTWHDHGHIGASPGAWIFTYPGKLEHSGFNINGFEVEEERGSPTVVFNIQFGDFSVTNFADMGIYDKDIFTDEQRADLRSTNIAFIRAGHEKVLDFCDPKIIIPGHYFPRQFIAEQIPEELKNDFEKPVKEIDGLLELINYPVEEINNYECNINLSEVDENKVIRFFKIHPQVKYLSEPKIKRSW